MEKTEIRAIDQVNGAHTEDAYNNLERLVSRLNRTYIENNERYYLCSDRLRFTIPAEHWVKKKYDEMKSFERGKLPYQFIKIFPHILIDNNGVAAKRVIHGASQKFNFVLSKASQVIEMSELIATRVR